MGHSCADSAVTLQFDATLQKVDNPHKTLHNTVWISLIRNWLFTRIKQLAESHASCKNTLLSAPPLRCVVTALLRPRLAAVYFHVLIELICFFSALNQNNIFSVNTKMQQQANQRGVRSQALTENCIIDITEISR